MGDKSPKSNTKKAGQKQAVVTKAVASKKAAAAAKPAAKGSAKPAAKGTAKKK